MANGDSIVGICNLALALLGQDPISALSDTGKSAALCSAHYDPTRRALLRKYPWNFARTQVQLATGSAVPLFDWDNAYPLPANCLRVIAVADAFGDAWDVYGGYLYCDLDAPLNVVIIQDVQDPTQFDAEFVQVLAAELASRIGIAVGTEAREALDEVRQQLEAWRESAQLTASQENSPRPQKTDIWLDSRR